MQAYTPATGTPTATPSPSLAIQPIPDAAHYFEFRGCDSTASHIFDMKDPSVNATIINGPGNCSSNGLSIVEGMWMDVTPFEFGGDFTVEIVYKPDKLGLYNSLLSFSDNLDGLTSATDNGIFVGQPASETGIVLGGAYSIQRQFTDSRLPSLRIYTLIPLRKYALNNSIRFWRGHAFGN